MMTYKLANINNLSLFRFSSVNMLVLIRSSRSAKQFHNTISHMVETRDFYESE